MCTFALYKFHITINPKTHGRISRKNRRGLRIIVTPAALKYLAEEGYDPEFGARPVKRVIHRLVLNRLSKDILAQKVDSTHPIVIDVDKDGELMFTN